VAEVIGRRRQREWGSLAADPNTPFMFGRLLGATELAAALLSQPEESANAKHIAEVLVKQSAFFFIDAPEPPPDRSSAVTGTMKTLGIGEP
jgi:hypothetical protein